MKINKLSLTNFRNHKRTEVTLDRINFFVGQNNAGKSSILAAIEWALTGRCLWTDRAGRGAADLVRQGEKQAAVALDLEGAGGIVRTMPPHSLQAGRVSGVNEGQAAIYNYLDAGEDRLRVALSAAAFMSMTLAEQRAFLFSAYGLSWDVEQVAAELARWLAGKGLREEDAARLARRAGSYYPAGILSGPEIFDAMDKRAREERKELKKDRQRVEAALAEVEAPVPVPEVPPGQAGEAEKRLGELKKRRDVLLQACGAGREAQVRRQSLMDKIYQAEKNLDQAGENINSLTAELDRLGEPEEDDGGDAENELLAKMDQMSKLAATAQGKREAIDKAGRALTAEDRRCPLAPQHLSCGLTGEQLSAVLITLRKEHKLATQELNSSKKDLARAREELDALKRKRRDSQVRSGRILALKGELNTQRQLASAIEQSIEAMEKEFTGLPEADGGALEELEEVDSALRENEGLVAVATEGQALAAKKATLDQDLAVLTADVADLDTLVKALGPDGLRRDMLASLLEGFTGYVNSVLGQLTEGTYFVTLSPEMEILCRAGGGPLLPLKLLSKSELLRVGIAIQCALSESAGLRFLAVDEADMLDQDNRDLLAGMLLDTAEGYDQALIFTTVGDLRPENPGLPGVKVFWVEDGTVSAL